MDINFYCRPSKASKKTGEANIEMSVVINGERTYIRLQRKCKPEDFEKAMASKKGNPIRQYCDTVRSRVNDLLTEMADARMPLTADNIKKCYKDGGVVKGKTINDIFKNYLETKASEVGSKITNDTYNRYEKSTALFYKYNPDLLPSALASEVSPEHLERMQIGLGKIYDPATSCNYLQKIKAIWTDAFQMGYIPSNPSWKMKIDKGVKDKILYLTQAEVARIREHKYIDRLQRVADLFLFSCYTGLAYSDMELLTPEDFQTAESGQIYIEKKRKKTGVRFVAVLMEDAKAIGKKYDFQLPMLTNQKYNAYLKEVGDIAQIPFPLTTHVGRHTACAYLLNHRNPTIPNETIIKIMGWKNEKMLRHYASLMRETLLSDVSTMSCRLGGKKINMKTIKRKYSE